MRSPFIDDGLVNNKKKTTYTDRNIIAEKKNCTWTSIKYHLIERRLDFNELKYFVIVEMANEIICSIIWNLWFCGRIKTNCERTYNLVKKQAFPTKSTASKACTNDVRC